MRFFNLVNFSSLLPSATPSNLNSPREQYTVQNPDGLLTQAQSITNLDFNFNNITINPERVLIKDWLRNDSFVETNNLSPIYSLIQSPEILNYTTLEVLNYTNSNASSTDES